MVNFKLDSKSYVPLYQQVKQFLIEQINAGKWLPGDKIHSETELVEMFNISRNTAKKAIEELENDGKVNRVQGRGTFVTQPKFEQSLSSFYSFSQVLEDQGMHPRDEILKIDIVAADAVVAKQLKIEVGREVVALQRLRYANDEPIILEMSYLKKDKIDNVDKLNQLGSTRLYDILKDQFQIHVVSAKESFEPVLIRAEEEAYLTVKVGSPALLLERIAYDENKNPVEFCKSIVRGDRCKFYTELL